jgi:fermentation-respiration switch protein FrsA (DUF1100 family)
MLAVDYRGYGRSTSSATVARVEHDAWDVWQWIKSQTQLDTTRVIVYGRSIGTGPAIHLAVTREVAGLIVESPFTSLRSLARRHYPLLPAFLAPGGFRNDRNIRLVRAPTLFIHGTRDAIIPADMSQTLMAAAGGSSELYLIDGADHNDTYDLGGDAYVRRFREFIDRVLTSR